AFCLLLLAGTSTIACTTFFINKNGQLVFGRNYDWLSDVGLVCKNAKGLTKTNFPYPNAGSITWVSKYGSLTFNQYGKEFPTGGMNEKGLVVELMCANGSQYPDEDARPEVDVLQWIQFQLDNCTTIDEVIADDQRIRIGVRNPPLHYLVADATGKAATIEFLNGKMVVHRGSDLPFPVLTNTDYATSTNMVRSAGMQGGNDVSASVSDNSLQRFAKACSMLQQFQMGDSKQSVIDFSFDVLKAVSQQSWTKWSIVYDLTNKAIYFKTEKFTTVKSIAFADFNFSCASPQVVLDMNQSLNGKVSKEFKPLTTEINRKLIDKSAEDRKKEVNIDEMDRIRKVDFAARIQCK